MLATLKDISHAALRMLVGTRAFTSGLLAVGTTKSAITIAGAIQYCVDGVACVKAITVDGFVFTDVRVQPISTTRYYLCCLDAAGTASIITGTATALPDCPDGLCPVGYVKIVTSGAGTFIPGTTLLDAAQITDTYVNLSLIPAGALV